MTNPCSIIRDLLPLYAEELVSADTAGFVEEHLRGCPSCREEYRRMREPQIAPPSQDDAAPLRLLRKKLAAKRAKTVVLTAVFVAVLLISAYAALDTPRYLPYSEELLSVEPVGGSGVQITFGARVTDFKCHLYRDGDGAFYCCDVEAWYTIWDRWFSGGEKPRSTILFPEEPYPIAVRYLPNDGTDSVTVYGDRTLEPSVALPRLALGYYLIADALVLLAAIAIWFAVRKKPGPRVWVERIGLYPVSYLLSHLLVMGFRTVSYAMVRDFTLILAVSLLLYCGLLLLYSLWHSRQENRGA